MTERRRGGLTEEELVVLADLIVEKMKGSPHFCTLTKEQQDAVVDIINTKKKAVKVTLWLFGALIIWILKDVYFYVKEHIGWLK